MLIRLLGPDVPEPMLKAFATATDHAKVRPADVHYERIVSGPVQLRSIMGKCALLSTWHLPA
jgi:hypothetical protein